MKVFVKELNSDCELLLYDSNNCECTDEYCERHLSEINILFQTDGNMRMENCTISNYYVNTADEFKELKEIFEALNSSITALVEIKGKTGMSFSEMLELAKNCGIDVNLLKM